VGLSTFTCCSTDWRHPGFSLTTWLFNYNSVLCGVYEEI
jgi:hypothetical protein